MSANLVHDHAVPVDPTTFDEFAFTAHTQKFLTEWLGDFTWNAQPMAGALARITAKATFPDGTVSQDMILWENHGGTWLSTPGAPVNTPDITIWEQMTENWFDERWGTVFEHYRLDGTWLHPETTWTADPYSWASGHAVLAIGTRDRNNPTAPRRYNADLSPTSHDLSVINFPLRSMWRIPEWLAEGYATEAVCLYTVATALAEGGVHEAMEMFQSAPGEPVWDPHNDNMGEVSLTVTFADGFAAVGSAH